MAPEYEIIKPEKASSKFCYVILPGGWKAEGEDWMRAEVDRSGWTFVGVYGADWNDDLTPWPAPGMFRKEKPFGGKAAEFLERLTEELLPEVEAGETVTSRALVGISLSGLFSTWAAMSCRAFDTVGCVSASLWYDGFAEWLTGLPKKETGLKKAFFLLGEKEKSSKDPRLSSVESRTGEIVEALKERGVDVEFVLDEGTHFSPARPRFDELGRKLF